MQGVAPGNESEVAELVRWALAERQPLDIRGRGSKSGFGQAVPDPVAVSLHGLSGILEYEPEELVMRALPGTPLEEVEAALAQHRQQLAFEPPVLALACGNSAAAGASIGGTFLANASGPRRLRAGAARDHILGVRAVDGRGVAWKSGGRVIKNVTGYDLSKLMAGSWGTLSIVTELCFKVLPAARASAGFAVTGLDAPAGLKLLRELGAHPLEASGLAYVPAALLPALAQELRLGTDDGGMVCVRIEGSAAGVEQRARILQRVAAGAGAPRRLKGEEAQVLWDSLREARPLAGCEVLLKLSLPPSATTRVLDQLPPDASWFADCGGGWIWIGLPQADAAQRIAALRAAGGGSCVLWRAPAAVRSAAALPAAVPPALQALNRRIKQAFDPAGILNPGRLGDA